jgi:hypothetical protein
MRTLISTFTILTAAASLAAQDAFPLPASAGSTTSTQNTAPFVIPARMTQTLVVDRFTLQAAGLGSTLNNWDMYAFDATGRFIFVPCENFGAGGGVFRYDTQTGQHVEIWRGNAAGAANRNPNVASFDPTNDDTVANDPCTWTPWNTIVFGEEATGGRFFECTNPLAATGPFSIVWHTSIPAVAHEGMRFDRDGNMYFIDESNSGCIYKFVPVVPGDLSQGQTFVLSIDAYAADPNAVPNEDFNSTANRLTTRIGQATWVALTGPLGQQITPTNPFTYVGTTGGRTAADEVLGTPFGRPEDLDFGTLANGNEVVYVALTSENRVLGIELQTGSTCMVRDFVNYDTINLYTGTDINPVQGSPYQSSGTGTRLNAPDNIAVDAFGGVYVIEDSTPGDVWKCIDADRDGVAEGMGLFITLGVGGSEPTGMIFDPVRPWRFICGIQHPNNGNDAIWAFETRPYPGSNVAFDLLSGVDAAARKGAGEFVRIAEANETVELKVTASAANLTSAPFVTLIQMFATSSTPPAFLPPLWLSPLVPSFLVQSGAIATGGNSFAVQVPAGLLGISVMTQGMALTSEGQLVLTDGVELILK